MTKEILLGTTESICPECFKVLPAKKIQEGSRVYLQKKCPQHGTFRVLIWEGLPSYTSWGRSKIPLTPQISSTEVKNGCPFDCGLCPQHRQETCCVLLEVTKGCNLQCPICFATAEKGNCSDPDLTEIEKWYQNLRTLGISNIQLSGGEPTIRDDLPVIIGKAREKGFSYIQLNTNGLRLGREPHFVKQLKDVGLSSVFLQFDGTNNDIYQKIRGTALLEIKKAAIDNCAQEGIGVVLVPTLVPGINLENIGEIINFALDRLPAVRGVHFQPISYFGRYPQVPPENRITIPQILQALERQTGGKIKVENFLPPDAENSYCSFQGNFILNEDGHLKPWISPQRGKSCCGPVKAEEGIKKSRAFVARQWSAPADNCSCPTGDKKYSQERQKINIASLDRFLQRVQNYTLSVSGMAFQDAWTLDLDRLRDCKVHVFSPDNKLIPFCAYNLTSRNGKSLYRT